MLTTAYYLAQAAQSGGSDTTVVTVVYILTGISLIIGFIIGTYKYIQKQKRKWTEEGVTRQRQAQAMTENTEQMAKLSGLTEKNTDAITTLTVKFSEFAIGVRTELNGMGDRIGKLEYWRQHQPNNKQDGN